MEDEKNGNNELEQNILKIKNELQQKLNIKGGIKQLYEKQSINGKKSDINNPKGTSIVNNNIHVAYFIPVLKYLDIKSIIELSQVNYSFYTTIYSYVFYHSVNKTFNFKNITSKSIPKINKQVQKVEQPKKKQNTSSDSGGTFYGQTQKIYSGFISALSGALNYITPKGELTEEQKEKNKLEEIKSKINLHEKLIEQKIQLIKISNDINGTRNKIDRYIKYQHNIKKSNSKNQSEEQDTTNTKKEKYEKEYQSLMDEINKLKNKYEEAKK